MSDFCFREIFFDNYYTRKFSEFLKPRISWDSKGVDHAVPPDYEVKGDSLLIKVKNTSLEDIDIDFFTGYAIIPSKSKDQKCKIKVLTKFVRVFLIPEGRVLEFKVRKDLSFVGSCYEDGILHIDFEQKAKQE